MTEPKADDAVERVRREVELIRMGADYTGMGNTHAVVPLELLKRIDDTLAALSTSNGDEVTEAMLDAGKAEYHRTWQTADSDDKVFYALRTIWTAMHRAK